MKTNDQNPQKKILSDDELQHVTGGYRELSDNPCNLGKTEEQCAAIGSCTWSKGNGCVRIM